MEDIGLWMDIPGSTAGLHRRHGPRHRPAAPEARPELAALLLLLAIPPLFVITVVTSLGNADLPAMFAIAMLASAETRKVATERAGLSTPAVPATQ